MYMSWDPVGPGDINPGLMYTKNIANDNSEKQQGIKATYAPIYIYSGLSKNSPISTIKIMSIEDTPIKLNDKIV